MTSPGRTETDCKGEPPFCDPDKSLFGWCHCGALQFPHALNLRPAPPQVPESEPGESEGESMTARTIRLIREDERSKADGRVERLEKALEAISVMSGNADIRRMARAALARPESETREERK